MELEGKQFSYKDPILSSGQLIFWLVETIFFLYCSETPASDSFFFYPLETMFQENTQFQLIPPARMKDYLKEYVSTKPKNCFAGRDIFKKTGRKWFPIVGERLLYKKWLYLNLNNGFH